MSTPETVSLSLRDKTWTCETKHCHALEEYDKDLRVVHELEKKLCILIRWVPGCEDWERMGKMVAMRKYQWALDQIEGLIVARMFELTKMNMLQTGEFIIFCKSTFIYSLPYA